MKCHNTVGQTNLACFYFTLKLRKFHFSSLMECAVYPSQVMRVLSCPVLVTMTCVIVHISFTVRFAQQHISCVLFASTFFKFFLSFGLYEILHPSCIRYLGYNHQLNTCRPEALCTQIHKKISITN